MTPSTWFVYERPVTGTTQELLARQAQRHVPGKLISRSRLRLEVLMRPGRRPSRAMRDAILDEWHAATPTTDPPTTWTGSDMGDRVEKTGAALTASHIEWTRLDDRFEWLASINSHRARCRATLWRSWLRLQAELQSLAGAPPAARAALAHVLVELNSKIQGCRASLTEQQVTVETVLSADDIEELLPVALGALYRAIAQATHIVPWILRDEVTQRYLAFHRIPKGGENDDGRHSRLVSLARSR